MRIVWWVLLAAIPARTQPVNLNEAVVVAPPNASLQERTAVRMLVEEVARRSQVLWRIEAAWPGPGRVAIAVGRAAAARLPAVPEGMGAEGFHLRVTPQAVLAAANTGRGAVFAAGGLLRALRMRPGKVEISGGLSVTSSPRFAIRGHQMGNRPLNNSVDAWTVSTWEQYIRDLAVFGVNAVELIPPYAFQGEPTPHFTLPPLDMMVEVSRLLDSYGMDVWIWYPALEKDYSDPRRAEAAAAECGKVFARMPRVDAVFVPGGDPGHTHPRDLMPYLEKLSRELKKSHPRAGVWVSPQGFDQEWLGEFLRALDAGPDYIAGVVYGPGVRVKPNELRARLPRRYPLRMYPDITHTVRSQHPVENWDNAYAMAYDREPINPRPLAQERIFRSVEKSMDGFITYSDGVNDDVNKFVWSALGWDPRRGAVEIVREYSRYFAGEEWGEGFAQALLGLERNWDGPLLANWSVGATLMQAQAIEREAGPRLLSNWRFQQLLYRAYYDAYLRNRLIRETALEAEAMERLADAPRTGSLLAVAEAERVLDEAVTRPRFAAWRSRLFELGAALFQSIGMQLSFDLYKANRRKRAASLDTMDTPLNDRDWLKLRFAEIRALADEGERLRRIDEIVNWKNPGPGGFYDDLGDPARQPRLVLEPESSATSVSPMAGAPLSWSSYASSNPRAPVKMRYHGLDPEARYRVRVVYAGDNVSQDQGIRLLADGAHTVHGYMKKPIPVRPVEFDVPPQATADGELELTWDREPTPSGRSRGAQVAEVWLIRRR